MFELQVTGETDKQRWKYITSKWTAQNVWGIPCFFPPTPPKKLMINYGKPKKQQKWVRDDVPKFWQPRRMKDFAAKHKLGEDVRWWEDEAFMKKNAPEQWAYIQQQKHYRKNGMWILINGKPTYLPGIFWFYLQHWHIGAETNDGYPIYTDRDRDLFWVWALRVQLDPKVYGLVYPAFRREGKSFKAGLMLFFKTAVNNGYDAGIQSQTEKDAKMFFQKKVVRPAGRLPAFFMPAFSGHWPPSSEMKFSEPSKIITRSAQVAYEDDRQYSIIDARSQVEEAYDGEKLKGDYVRDECGKTKDLHIDTAWEIVKECLTDSGSVIGKAFYPTTVGEMEKKGGKAFQNIYRMSNPENILPNGSTVSGMLRLFMPVSHGFRGDDDNDVAFIDEFGASREAEAREYWEKYRHRLKSLGEISALNQLRRKYPLEEDDLFLTDEQNSPFNTINIERCLDELKPTRFRGGGREDDLIVVGDLVFRNDHLRFEQNLWSGSRVEFRHNPNGRFMFNGLPPAQELNRFRWQGQTCYLTDPDKYFIGVDPIKNTQTTSWGVSQAAAHGGRRFDPKLDSGKPWFPDCTRSWETHKIVFEYCERAALNSVEEFHQDMAKAALFLGAKINMETNVQVLFEDFRRWGLMGLLLPRAPVFISNSPSTRVDQYGAPGSTLTKEVYIERIKTFIAEHCWAERIPFVRTLKQCKKFDPANTQEFDLVVSLGYLLVALHPNDWGVKEEMNFSDYNINKIHPDMNQAGNYSVEINGDDTFSYIDPDKQKAWERQAVYDAR